jgi:hypothetical protein
VPNCDNEVLAVAHISESGAAASCPPEGVDLPLNVSAGHFKLVGCLVRAFAQRYPVVVRRWFARHGEESLCRCQKFNGDSVSQLF